MIAVIASGSNMPGFAECSRILERHQYKDLKQIGEGSFGKAILVQAGDGSKLVCKMVNMGHCSQQERQDTLKEGRLLAAFRHPFIVQYRESFVEKGWLCILMSFCEGGDLTSAIEAKRRENQFFSEDQVVFWMTEALLALKYIHERHVLHRDLKSSNFFVSAKGHLQMGDFGIATVLSNTAALAKTMIGTPNYMSPEACQEKPYTWPSDIWAMGCVLYELCALKLPFEGANFVILTQKIVRDPLPTMPPVFSRFLHTLYSAMMTRNPKYRPSASSILQRPQMQNVIKQIREEAAAFEAAQQAKGMCEESSTGYHKGDLVEYFSGSQNAWLAAIVIGIDVEGKVEIDIKPSLWFDKEQQEQRLRPRVVEEDPPEEKIEEEKDLPDKEAAQKAKAALAGDKEFSKLCEELGIDKFGDSLPVDALAAGIGTSAAASSTEQRQQDRKPTAGIAGIGGNLPALETDKSMDLLAAGEAALLSGRSPRHGEGSLTLAELELLDSVEAKLMDGIEA